MGVYIKGMKMPKGCLHCSFSDEFGDCCCKDTEPYECEFNNNGSCPDWCPLVPVPKHGRLIDVRSLENMYFTKEMYDANSKLFVPFVEVASAIFNAPTIIEAEEGER